MGALADWDSWLDRNFPEDSGKPVPPRSIGPFGFYATAVAYREAQRRRSHEGEDEGE